MWGWWSPRCSCSCSSSSTTSSFQVPSSWDMRVKVVAMVEEVREEEGDVGMVVTLMLLLLLLFLYHQLVPGALVLGHEGEGGGHGGGGEGGGGGGGDGGHLDAPRYSLSSCCSITQGPTETPGGRPSC